MFASFDFCCLRRFSATTTVLLQHTARGLFLWQLFGSSGRVQANSARSTVRHAGAVSARYMYETNFCSNHLYTVGNLHSGGMECLFQSKALSEHANKFFVLQQLLSYITIKHRKCPVYPLRGDGRSLLWRCILEMFLFFC